MKRTLQERVADILAQNFTDRELDKMNDWTTAQWEAVMFLTVDKSTPSQEA